jgi:hypothetical protein
MKLLNRCLFYSEESDLLYRYIPSTAKVAADVLPLASFLRQDLSDAELVVPIIIRFSSITLNRVMFHLATVGSTLVNTTETVGLVF